MLDAKFLHKTGWKHTRCESSTENFIEFIVKTSDSHVLKLEVGSQDCIGRCSDPDDQPGQAGQVGKVHLLVLDLSLIKLSAAFMNVTSVLSINIPMFS